MKLQRYDDALQQCAEAENAGYETNTARYTFGLYKAQALSLKGKQYQDLKILEEQFAETYTFQFSEKDQSPVDHQRDKILRELSQFNSGVCHFRGDDLISSRNCIETQRFNLENNINPLKSVFGIIQEICLNRREGGGESRSFARILDDHFQFSIYQDI